MKNVVVALVLSLLVTACKKSMDEGSTQQDKSATAVQTTFANLQQEAMDAHDAIMPKMGELMKLKQQLELLDSATPAVQEHKMALQVAYDDMMSWMHSYSEKFPYEFKLPEDATAAAQKLEQMKEEHQKIVALKGRTLEAIAQAQALLGK